MSTAEKMKLECTGESGVGYIHTIEDVYNAFVYSFTTSTKKDSQLAGRNPIHHYNFVCHLSKNDPIQRPDESFVTLDGISKRYQMIVKNKGTIHWRMRSCWCLGCIDGLSNGTLGWGQTHVVQRCVAVGEVSSGHERGGDTNLDGNMYSFEQKNASKLPVRECQP